MHYSTDVRPSRRLWVQVSSYGKLYYSTTQFFSYSNTLLFYFTTAIQLNYSTAILCYTFILLYYSPVILFYHYTSLLLYCSTILLRCYSVTLLLCHFATLLLYLQYCSYNTTIPPYCHTAILNTEPTPAFQVAGSSPTPTGRPSSCGGATTRRSSRSSARRSPAARPDECWMGEGEARGRMARRSSHDALEALGV